MIKQSIATALQLKDKMAELKKEVLAGDEQARVPVGVVKMRSLKQHARKYYRYVGSLTTPPCTENVVWNVLGRVINQISHFRRTPRRCHFPSWDSIITSKTSYKCTSAVVGCRRGRWAGGKRRSCRRHWRRHTAGMRGRRRRWTGGWCRSTTRADPTN